MTKILKTFIVALFVIGLSFTAQASTQQAAPKVKWSEIIPTYENTDRDAEAIARAVLKDDIKTYFSQPSTDAMAATFFNAPGLEKNSFIIVLFYDTGSCGNWGCLGYFLKKSPGVNNQWKAFDQGNINSILSAPELSAKTPSFYVMGPAKAGYGRYNAATGKYEATK